MPGLGLGIRLDDAGNDRHEYVAQPTATGGHSTSTSTRSTSRE